MTAVKRPISVLSDLNPQATKRLKSRRPPSIQPTEDVPFPYPPLKPGSDSFRLLKLLPDKDRRGIHCQLYTPSISEEEDQYTAISYTWGSPSPMKTIHVNGSPFAVRQNLYDFCSICMVRKDYPLLWIDAICIDQASIAERKHQVAIMGDIYRRAKRVYAWLGQGDFYSDWYLDYMSRYSAKSLMRYLGRRRISIGKELRFEQGRESVNSRSNWSRIWIVQEIMLAKKVKVICGYKSADWDDLGRLEALVTAEEWYVDCRGLPNRFNMLQRSRKRGKDVAGQDLGDLLTKFGDMEFELPQDHVYALLGLATPLDTGEKVHVDYARPLMEILRNVLQSITLKDPIRFVKHLYDILGLDLKASTTSTTMTLRLPLLCLVTAKRVSYGTFTVDICDTSKGWLPSDPGSSLELYLKYGGNFEPGDVQELLLFHLDAPSKSVPNAVLLREPFMPCCAEDGPRSMGVDSTKAAISVTSMNLRPFYTSPSYPILELSTETARCILERSTFSYDPLSCELSMHIDMKHLLDLLAALNSDKRFMWSSWKSNTIFSSLDFRPPISL